MTPKDQPPPPIREEKRRLSLRTAIAAATKFDSTIAVPSQKTETTQAPSVTKTDSQSATDQDLQTNLLELQADIIIREDQLNEKAAQLSNRERELNEKCALLEAHRKVVESRQSRRDVGTGGGIDSNERKAFEALKRELDAQEISLKTAKAMLQEREAFIEKCENDLVEKSMLLTEREARIEQREEDFDAKVFANELDEDAV